MTTGEVGRSCSSTGSLADVLRDVHAAHDAAGDRVVGRQLGVGRGDDEELAARGARGSASVLAIATMPVV